ncbi:hypothetical protein BDA99DRAFT_514433 [Phascolomyces articulosus]|uniref:RRM domain-containing protein n=1 Tax=Phascolomyces articulosus TaxID=60185 RepID=A0AAD5JXM4_9FUNG|nr:hypothetical protein BDA99DRAFT_514433 [Phascolomyces articulosus]
MTDEPKKRTLSEVSDINDDTSKRARPDTVSEPWNDDSAINLTLEQKERLENAKNYAREMKSKLATPPPSTYTSSTATTTPDMNKFKTTRSTSTFVPNAQQQQPALATAKLMSLMPSAAAGAPGTTNKITPHAILSATNPHIHSGVDIRTLSVLARIYIGSINFELTEAHIRTAFQQFGTIKTISMSMNPVTMRHKGFCFLEYETPEAASLAVETLNGADFGGRPLKVGRPNNYATAASSAEIPIPPKSRIYIANINEMITEDNIQNIFEAFGQIKKCILLPDFLSRKHKGYGFIEFEDETAATTAMESMKNFEIGGQILRVSRCIVGGALTEGMKVLDSMPPPSATSAPGVVVPGLPPLPGQPGVTPGMTGAMTPVTTTGITSTPGKDDVMSKVNANIENLGLRKKIDLLQHQSYHPFQHQYPQFQQQQQQNSSQQQRGYQHDPTAVLRAAKLAKENAKASNDSVAKEEDMHVNSSQRYEIMQKLAASRQELSTYLLVQNAVSIGEVDDSLSEEFSDECSKFGKVEKVTIQKSDDDNKSEVREQPGWQPGDGDVKIFVQFETSSVADKARQVLDGRWFGGRKLKAQVIQVSDLDRYGIH